MCNAHRRSTLAERANAPEKRKRRNHANRTNSTYTQRMYIEAPCSCEAARAESWQSKRNEKNKSISRMAKLASTPKVALVYRIPAAQARWSAGEGCCSESPFFQMKNMLQAGFEASCVREVQARVCFSRTGSQKER